MFQFWGGLREQPLRFLDVAVVLLVGLLIGIVWTVGHGGFLISGLRDSFPKTIRGFKHPVEERTIKQSGCTVKERQRATRKAPLVSTRDLILLRCSYKGVSTNGSYQGATLAKSCRIGPKDMAFRAEQQEIREDISRESTRKTRIYRQSS